MTHPRYNGRATRVRAHLASHPTGSTILQLIAAVDPGCEHNIMAATVSTLVRQGKARAQEPAEGERGNRYFPTATTLVDRRAAANASAAATRRGKPRKRRAAAASAHSRRTGEHSATSSRTAGPGDAIRQAICNLAKAPPRTRVAAAVADDGRETVEQFQQRGGQVQRLPPGASATPLNITQHDLNEASMRRRKARLAGAI